ncbi:hypothetical protein PIB30_050653 [Stylosanthes scabra]|uniref:DUF4220 domain-containing protein n=1 Tax=Stylosanthes scabra TaxID=79078 RepID=A0ABU6WG23_9FABA|nr:hypothetical protein [Stylosanthes scabra]
MNVRGIIQKLPQLWSVLELPVLVMVSLFLQTALILLGSRRKHTRNAIIQFFVWSFYLSADWIATIALGILSKDMTTIDSSSSLKHSVSKFVVMATWAPFLLVHLGGPDTITAYSLEDNELWLRHFIGLLYQCFVAGYVVYKSWNGNHLNFVTIPLIVAGMIKYVERTWSLRSGSSQNFRESIIPAPDPGPNYAKFMDHFSAKKAEGYRVSLGKVIKTAPAPLTRNANASSLSDGFYFFKIFKCLFSDLILSFQDHKSSQDYFRRSRCEHAFQVVEVELGLMYDVLYTKAILTYTGLGIFFKFVSISCTISAFVVFCLLVDIMHMDKDQVITFVLFIGAILLEIYAVIVLLSSSWTMIWLSKRKNWVVNLLYKFISGLQILFRLSHTRSWSNQMSQFNLINFCLNNKPIMCVKVQKCLHIYQFFEKDYYTYTDDVSQQLKTFIFGELLKMSDNASGIEACKKLCAHRGDRVLNEKGRHEFDWSIEVEFDQSMLLWHIATDLCYYSDESVEIESCVTSRLLSNYMMYLLVQCPFMLPNGIGQIRFDDTCAEAKELLLERKYIKKGMEACKMILDVNTEIPPSDVKGDRSKSVLFDACRLAKSLQELETKKHWTKQAKWEMISRVWLEMLCHAASHCRGCDHARQLSKGGELLTHVWLLMAHLGITEQFQISQGHVRAKLIVE